MGEIQKQVSLMVPSNGIAKGPSLTSCGNFLTGQMEFWKRALGPSSLSVVGTSWLVNCVLALAPQSGPESSVGPGERQT